MKKIFQSRLERDFEFFVKALPYLEPVEFIGLAKVLSVPTITWSEDKEAPIKESIQTRPMDEVIEDMMDKFLALPKHRRKEINQMLKDIKKLNKKVKKDGAST